MPMMILNRKHTLGSTYGHSVLFEKDTPVHVPPLLYPEAIAIGAIAADGSVPSVLQDAPPSTTPIDPVERATRISAAVERLIAANNRSDFAASGMPTVKAVSRETSFEVYAKEVAVAWQAYHDAKAAV